MANNTSHPPSPVPRSPTWTYLSDGARTMISRRFAIDPIKYERRRARRDTRISVADEADQASDYDGGDEDSGDNGDGSQTLRADDGVQDGHSDAGSQTLADEGGDGEEVDSEATISPPHSHSADSQTLFHEEEDDDEEVDSGATVFPPDDDYAATATATAEDDLYTGPRTPVHQTNFNINDDDSPLSSLGDEPPSPDEASCLIAWRQEQRAEYGPICTCTGWCTCTKYKHFISSEHCPEVRTVGGWYGDEDEEGPKVVEQGPSQTHLTEAVLANWKPAESEMRSTMVRLGDRGWKRKRRAVKGEVEVQEPQAEFTWDRERPERAPVGWEGGDWEEGEKKSVKISTDATVEAVDQEAGVDVKQEADY